jgi:SAM-dependent methyltransferase
VLAGIGVLPEDLLVHLQSQGLAYRRIPVHDPRLARFLLAKCGTGHDIVPFDLVIAHYCDLVVEPPAGYDNQPCPGDRSLALALARHAGDRPGRCWGLVVGCGVGRAVFITNEHVEWTVGVDSSVAQIRRARNIAVSQEHFFLPGPREMGIRELRVDLSRLARERTDFFVAEAECLPILSASFDVVVVTLGDSRGPWANPGRVHKEARRVLRPGGLLLTAQADGLWAEEQLP